MIHVAVSAPAPAVRAGLLALLGEDEEIELVWEAAWLEEVNDLPTEPDVLVVVDTAFVSDESSVRTEMEGLLLSYGSAAILLLTTGEETSLDRLLPGMHNRAWGILPLDCSAEELLAAVKSLHLGLLVGAPSLLQKLMITPSQEGEPLSDLTADALTERELQVLQLLAQGLANKQIAATLGISEHTVKFHVSGIYSKLGASSRTEAVRLGVRQGLIVL